ncbi:MAG TPA: hypothetical protein VEF76_14435 [Patescibacteria group bacterium]|nr:hypothetical protein [Patescibacteria group bacterium]
MDNNKGLSSKFNKVVKGALAGAGIAVVGAALLPVVTVSAPVIVTGAIIGGFINGRNK